MRLEPKIGLEPFPGYRLTQILGSGGWGVVWKASSPEGRPVALKFINTSTNQVSSQEIKALQAIKQLRHPHLLEVYHIWSCPGFLVIAMELADGSMHDLLDLYLTEINTPIQPDHVLHFLNQAAEAIDFLNTRQHLIHSQRVAIRHCDVKPSNLLLVGSTLKLADFSLSFPTTATMGNHTRTGTLHYAAPEIFQGIVSDKSDLFSLAVSYYHLRTGKYPYPTPPARFQRGYIRPEPNLEGITAGEQEVLLRALNPVPQARWSSCVEMIQQLQNCLAPLCQAG